MFLVAEREGRIVAFLIATMVDTIPIYRLEQTGYFHDMWVEPEYRNEGIARRMTMLAIEAFGKMGVTQIRMETATANEPARNANGIPLRCRRLLRARHRAGLPRALGNRRPSRALRKASARAE